MLLSRLLALILLLACPIHLAACGADSTGKDQLPETHADPAAALPGWDELTRLEPRTVMNHGAVAEDCIAVSSGAEIGEGIVSLPSSAGGMEWGIWGWYGLSDDDYPQNVTLLNTGDGGEFWVFVSDFSRRSWRSFGPYTETVTHVDLSAQLSRRCGRDGTFYVAVATWDGMLQEVRAINVSTASAVNAPAQRQHWLSASQDSASGSVTLSWEYPLAGSQRLCRWVSGQAESLAQILPAQPGTQSYTDTSAAPGQHLCYRVLNMEGGALRAASPIALGRAGSPTDGHRLYGRLIYDAWHSAQGRELWLSGANLTTSSDGDGHFSFPALPSGSYGLHRVVGDEKQLVGSYNISSNYNLGSLVTPLHGMPPGNWYWLYPPTNVLVENAGSSSIRLTWSSVKFATHYEIFRSFSQNDANPVLVATTSATEQVLTSQPAGMSYYSVVAVDEPYSRRSAPSGSIGHTSAGGFSPDSIFAVPSRTKVSAGENVRITVYSSQSADPLLYLDGVRVLFASGNTYVPDSFNLGLPGGARYMPDGVWGNIAGDLGFLEIPDLWWKEKSVGNQSCIDFNITPINGRQSSSVTGALFSFEICVWQDTSLGFQRMDNWNRTYYSGADNSPCYWSNDSNDGMPGIEVTNN